MTTNTGFFKTYYDRDRGWMWNGHPIEMISGTKVEVNDKKFNITPGIQKVLTDLSNIPLKKLNNKDNEIFIIFLDNLGFENYEALRGESKSGRYKQSKSNFKKHNLKGRGFVKFIIPSNMIDIYTRLEILLRLKISGHTGTLTEASHLIDELYKRGDIQTELQYPNAHNKFQT